MKRARTILWTGILVTVLVAVGFYLLRGPRTFAGPFETVKGEAFQRSEEAYDLTLQANQQLIDAWLKHQLWSWRWWFNVCMAIIPWWWWRRIRPKASAQRLLHVGLVLMVISSYLDFLGVTYGLWRYHIEIIPSIPSYTPWDFTLYPVSAMLLLQWEPMFSKHLKALFFACAAALVVEPLFVWLQFYEPVKWSVFFSLPIHYGNYLVAHWVANQTAFAPLVKEAPPEWNPP